LKIIVAKLIPYIISWFSLDFVQYVVAKAIHHPYIKINKCIKFPTINCHHSKKFS
jgi:hypothetical protein